MKIYKRQTNQRQKFIIKEKSLFEQKKYPDTQGNQSQIQERSIGYSKDTVINRKLIQMKQVVHSQKNYMSQYSYLSNSTIVKHQSPHLTVAKKSSAISKKLQQCIQLNTTQTIRPSKQNQYHFINSQIAGKNLPLSCSLSDFPVKNFQQGYELVLKRQFASPYPNHPMSPNITKPKKPTQKPISTQKNPIQMHYINEYKRIIANLNEYYKYYEWILNKQVMKHDAYFVEIIKMVQCEKKKSQIQLNKQINQLYEVIQVRKGALANKISSLEANKIKFNMEKERAELDTQKYLQIPLFQVKTIALDKFRQELQKYCFGDKTTEQLEKQRQLENHRQNDKQMQKQQNDKFEKESIADTIQLEQSVQTIRTCTKQRRDYDDLTYTQIGQMTPIHPSKQQYAYSARHSYDRKLQNEDLYCDQVIQNILKDNKILGKKRYECTQKMIPQESESHEDSLVISNVQTMR